MQNVFLKVDKRLFSMGLNPTEILILSQVIEFQNNTGDCFISDKQLSEQFGVSESTISREIKKLESMGLLTRETKNVKGGKERHLKAHTNSNLTVVEETNKFTTSNLTVDNKQNDCCTNVNLPIDNKQIDLIKDNIKDNSKEKRIYKENEIPEEEKGSLANPHIVSKDWLIAHHNEVTAIANGLFMYGGKFVKMEGRK